MDIDKQALRQASVALADKLSQPDEFIAALHRLLEANSDEKAFANYHRIIPEMGTTFGTPLPVLRVIAAEIAWQGKKEPQSVLPLLKTLWDNGSFEDWILTLVSSQYFGASNPQTSPVGWMRQLVGVFADRNLFRKTETSFGIHIPQLLRGYFWNTPIRP